MPHPAFHLCELTGYLAGLATRCRAARAYDALFGISVAQDIAADLSRQESAVAALAYKAEQEDAEAIRLIEDAARDGFSAADGPALVKALRLIRASARHDHEAAARLG